MSELIEGPALLQREAENHFSLAATAVVPGIGTGAGYAKKTSPVAAPRARRRAQGAPAGSRRAWSAAYAWRLRLSDAAVCAGVLAVAFASSQSAQPVLDGLPAHWLLWLCLLGLVLWNLDLEYGRSREHKGFGAGVGEYRTVVQSTLRAFGILAMVMVVLGVQVPRLFFAVALPAGLVLLLLNRHVWRSWLGRRRRAGQYLSPALVVGSAAEVHHVVQQLERSSSTGYKVSGMALTHEVEGPGRWQHLPVLSTIADIDTLVAAAGAQAVVVAGKLPGGPAAIQELGWRLGDLDTELVVASSLANVAGPRLHFRPADGLPLMHVELPRYSGIKHVVKRAVDVVLAAVGLVLIMPLLLLLAGIVKADSPGPALFSQHRVGKNGGTFRLWKFRSMVADAPALQAALRGHNEGSGVLFKMADDPRITRCGKWMRKYSLDELPQLWNVLAGHMSLVGPRPPLAEEVAQYESPVQRRLLIKPGITGLWQTSGRSDLPWEEAVRLDLYYVENWSLTGDLIILWRTVRTVLEPAGAY
ncbi:sugar transferase [Specibacter sp. NPDC057265]|uniref:sugar transferase n=1 Tax=Specibacter sp. NPDC057265 TaxID=3346075 RepID=UPI0036367E24